MVLGFDLIQTLHIVMVLGEQRLLQYFPGSACLEKISFLIEKIRTTVRIAGVWLVLHDYQVAIS